MTFAEIMNYVSEKGKTKDEQIRILKKIRSQLLCEIHLKQQLLDQVDYTIYKIKKDNQEDLL